MYASLYTVLRVVLIHKVWIDLYLDGGINDTSDNLQSLKDE